MNDWIQRIKLGGMSCFFHEFGLDLLVLKASDNSLQACFCGFLQVKMQLVKLHSKCDEKNTPSRMQSTAWPPINL